MKITIKKPRLIIILILLSSCSNCKNKKYEKIISEKEKAIESFKNENNRLKYIETKMLKQAVTSETFPLLTYVFSKCFKDSSLNLNSNIDTVTLKVKLSVIEQATDFKNLAGNTNKFIALYPVLVDTVNTNSYLSYIIAKAERTLDALGKDTIQPIPFNNKYLLINANNIFGKYISATRFDTLVNQYKNSVQFINELKGETTHEDIKDYVYPYVSYHTGADFFDFYNHNKNLFNSETNVLVRLFNGAIYPNKKIKLRGTSTSTDMFCQSPILAFEENNSVMLGSRTRGDEYYANKALDVGRLCPPQCD